MKYRTKLYIALVSVAFISILLGILIFSFESHRLLMNMLKSRSLSIVATAAIQLDPVLVEKANRATSVDDPEYIKLRDLLRTLLSANQRSDVYISDLYTLFPDPNDPKQLRFGVETDVDPDLPQTIYNYSDKDLIIKNRNIYFVDPFFIADQYGVWLSAIAPIRDNQGNYLSSLVADIDATEVYKSIETLIKFACLGIGVALLLAFIIALFLSKTVTRSLRTISSVVGQIGQGNLDVKAEVKSKDEFGDLATEINSMVVGLKEKERLKVSFTRYVSQHVLEQVLKSETPLKLEGERRKITILFSDIRGFTRIAEQLPPEEVVQLLNEYFEKMIEVVFAFSGTLDKFIGDGLMVEFGAPLRDEQQEEHAILAAIEMQKQLYLLCEKWTQEGKPIFQVGIGIHTGEAIVGNIGSERRVDYTAIGDSVNVAARLETATKMHNIPILISETTYQGAKDKFPFKDLGSITLPGRKESVQVYTVPLPQTTWKTTP